MGIDNQGGKDKDAFNKPNQQPGAGQKGGNLGGQQPGGAGGRQQQPGGQQPAPDRSQGANRPAGGSGVNPAVDKDRDKYK